LVGLPGAVALAVGAALVHGFVSSGSRNPSLRADGPAIGRNPDTFYGLQQRTPAPNHQKALTEGTTKTQLNAALASGAYKGAFSAFRDAVVIPKNRLVHADASLEVKVGSHAALSKATNNATQIVAKLGGYAQS